MISEQVIPKAEGFKLLLDLWPPLLWFHPAFAARFRRRKTTHEKRSGADEARLAAADSSSSRARERVSATPSAGLERRPVEFLHQAIGKLLQEFKWHFESGRSIQGPSALCSRLIHRTADAQRGTHTLHSYLRETHPRGREPEFPRGNPRRRGKGIGMPLDEGQAGSRVKGQQQLSQHQRLPHPKQN